MKDAIEKAKKSKRLFKEVLTAEEVEQRNAMVVPIKEKERGKLRVLANIFFGVPAAMFRSVSEQASRISRLVHGAKQHIINIYNNAKEKTTKALKTVSGFLTNGAKFLLAIWLIWNNHGLGFFEYIEKLKNFTIGVYDIGKTLLTSWWKIILKYAPAAVAWRYGKEILSSETFEEGSLKALNILKCLIGEMMWWGTTQFVSFAASLAKAFPDAITGLSELLGVRLKISVPNFEVTKERFLKMVPLSVKTNYEAALKRIEEKDNELRTKIKDVSGDAKAAMERELRFFQLLKDYYTAKLAEKASDTGNSALQATKDVVAAMSSFLVEQGAKIPPAISATLNRIITSETEIETEVHSEEGDAPEVKEYKSKLKELLDVGDKLTKKFLFDPFHEHQVARFLNITKEYFSGTDIIHGSETPTTLYDSIKASVDALLSQQRIGEMGFGTHASLRKERVVDLTPAFKGALDNSNLFKAALEEPYTIPEDDRNNGYRIDVKKIEEDFKVFHIQDYFTDPRYDAFKVLEENEALMYQELNQLIDDLAKVESLGTLEPEQHVVVVAIKDKLQAISRDFLDNRDRRVFNNPFYKLNNSRA